MLISIGGIMKGLFCFIIFAMLLVCMSYANAQIDFTTTQTDTVTTTTTPAETALPPADIKIVVDRNPKVQEAVITENGVETKRFPVSTGRETFDFNEGNYHVNPYCSFTETTEEASLAAVARGEAPIPFFKVQRLREMNVSDTWSAKDAEGNITSKTQMPNAVFFYGGTAFHSVDVTTEYGRTALTRLGPKESPSKGGSGACIRLSPENSKYVFDLFASKDSLGQYAKTDPRTTPECYVSPGETMSHKCLEPQQWPVSKKKLSAQIIVMDSRTPEEQKKAHQECESIKSVFIADKRKCIIEKTNTLLKLHSTQQSQLQTAVEPRKNKVPFFKRIFGGKNRAQEEIALPVAPPVVVQVNTQTEARKALTEDVFSDVNAECNKLGHEKIKSGILRGPLTTSPRPQPRPAKPAATPGSPF